MRSRLLKILAVIALGTVTLPLMLTNDVLAFGGFNPLRFAGYYAAFGLFFSLGFGLARIKRRRRIPAVVLRGVGVICFFPALALLLFTDSLALVTAAGLCSVLWYFIGERAVNKHYADLFPAFMLAVYIVVTLAAYIFYGSLAPDELREPVRNAVAVMFAVELALSAVLINQSGIYDKASRRAETRTMLPKGLSGYNAALVLIILSAGLGLYFFKDAIIAFLTTIGRLLVQLFVWLMRGNADSMEIDEGEAGDLSLSYAAEGNAGEIMTVIFVVALIAALIVFRKKIWSFIKELGKRIYSFFSREQQENGEEMGFVDFVEEIPAKSRGEEYVSDSRLLRLYRAERDKTQKYRLGYRIILRSLNRNKAGIVPPDTVGQQLGKGKMVFGGELDNAARVYNGIRYNNEKAADEQLNELEELRKKLS